MGITVTLNLPCGTGNTALITLYYKQISLRGFYILLKELRSQIVGLPKVIIKGNVGDCTEIKKEVYSSSLNIE